VPGFFEQQVIAKCKKLLKLMTLEPSRNEEACATLTSFFPDWQKELKDAVFFAEMQRIEAENELRQVKRVYSGFDGQPVPRRLLCARATAAQTLTDATRRKRNLNATLEKAQKLATAYQDIVLQRKEKPCTTESQPK
jgi:hypothetical protein